MQAPIPALREDGVRVFVTGTILALLLTSVTALAHERLASTGHGWLVWVGLSCVVIGLCGTAYCWARRQRHGSA